MGIVPPPLLWVIRAGWDSEVPEKFPEKLMQHLMEDYSCSDPSWVLACWQNTGLGEAPEP
jgi:hypothetical protein